MFRFIETLKEFSTYARVKPILRRGQLSVALGLVTRPEVLHRSGYLGRDLINATLGILHAHGKESYTHALEPQFLPVTRDFIIMPQHGRLRFETDYTIQSIFQLDPELPESRAGYKFDKGECPIAYFR